MKSNLLNHKKPISTFIEGGLKIYMAKIYREVAFRLLKLYHNPKLVSFIVTCSFVSGLRFLKIDCLKILKKITINECEYRDFLSLKQVILSMKRVCDQQRNKIHSIKRKIENFEIDDRSLCEGLLKI